MAHVLNQPRLKLYMDPNRPASDLERAAFRELVERAMNDEPVDYLVGQAPFFSMMLKVSPAVLMDAAEYDRRFDAERHARLGIEGLGWVPGGLTVHDRVQRLLPGQVPPSGTELGYNPSILKEWKLSHPSWGGKFVRKQH